MLTRVNEIKPFALTVLSGILAYLNPISGNVFAMTYLLFANFVVGLLASLVVEGEKFSWRKFGWCGVEALIFFALVASIYVVGYAQGNPEEAVQCVSMVVYAMCYFYGTRILRNLRTMCPSESIAWHMMDFLYGFATLELLKRLPFMEEYVKSQKRKKDEKH